ncbi:HflC protein [Methylotenera oryzisoli]|jgi:regulator of protease activity HflC (stomatin/prohibitin superfamily)|uniref:HflC protein n=1 Tax=Methylotenera oryzisoli TaxID=2080758 RepID=A0A4Y9VW23_9PROT|nr:prohibitin family protein [Methylotenera oryzisoli]TFW73421.1 HflC protein [Methylotenera oryzisoli]
MAILNTPSDQSQSGIIRTIKFIAILIAALILISWLNPFVVINAGHRGVITTFGKVNPTVLEEGLHFRIPIMQQVTEINVQIQKGEGDGDAASRDLQQVHAKIALNYHLIPNRVAETYQAIGDLGSVGDRIIIPAVQEATKATTAKYTAEELISKRPEVRDQISQFMRDRLLRHGIQIDEFSIVNFRFSESFNQAIEAKTTAEQLKLKAERDLERIRVEAEQKIASAKAEAESLRLQKQEITPDLLKLREIENQRVALEKWDGRLPQVTGGSVPLINIK